MTVAFVLVGSAAHLSCMGLLYRTCGGVHVQRGAHHMSRMPDEDFLVLATFAAVIVAVVAAVLWQ